MPMLLSGSTKPVSNEAYVASRIRQNDAATTLLTSGAEQVHELPIERQRALGGAILHAADYGAFAAQNRLPTFLAGGWPEDFLLGIVLEGFVDGATGRTRLVWKRMRSVGNAFNQLETYGVDDVLKHLQASQIGDWTQRPDEHDAERAREGLIAAECDALLPVLDEAVDRFEETPW